MRSFRWIIYVERVGWIVCGGRYLSLVTSQDLQKVHQKDLWIKLDLNQPIKSLIDSRSIIVVSLRGQNISYQSWSVYVSLEYLLYSYLQVLCCTCKIRFSHQKVRFNNDKVKSKHILTYQTSNIR